MLIDSIPANLHAREVDALLASRVALLLSPLPVDLLVSSARVYEEAVETDDAPIMVRGGQKMRNAT
jgi:hypothetical protein